MSDVTNLKIEPNISSEMIVMTPVLAMSILRKNTHNRPLSNATVKRYSKLMSEERWELNGEAVIIANDGALVDGQHRLRAVIDSGKNVPMFIVRGVSGSSYKTVDVGKTRSGADALAVLGEEYVKHRLVLAAAAKIVMSFNNDTYNCNQYKTEHDALIEFVEKNKGLMRSVEYAVTLHSARKIVPFSALAAMHFLFCKKDVDEAEKFFHKLDTGEHMNKFDPVNLLRNKLFILSQSGGVIRAREVIPYLVKAWELVREGREVTRLIVQNDYTAKVV